MFNVQHLARYAGAAGPSPGDQLVDPRWDLVMPGTATTYEALGGRWAPSPAYGTRVSTIRSDLVAFSAGQPGRRPTSAIHFALAAGHHNSGGGNPTEHELVGPITKAIAERARTAGFRVSVITPDDGLGDFPGDRTKLAQRVVEIDRSDRVDLFLEVHTEGNDGGDRARGCFAIYPDWAPDVDVDVRDGLGPEVARRLLAKTGIPLRGAGTMSERGTGVGSEGDRLGVFLGTAPIRDHCTRLIIEFGAHTSSKDLEILRSREHRGRAAEAVIEAIKAFYGVEEEYRFPENISPNPRAWHCATTDKWVVEPSFLDFYGQRGADALRLFGLPIEGQVGNIQYFERARFERYPERTGTPYEVQLGLLGSEITEYRRDESAFGRAEPGDSESCTFFEATGHNLCSGFRGFWQRHGGLTVFGYPISEELEENGMTVQYFERARFEWHREKPAGQQVLLGLLGTERLRAEQGQERAALAVTARTGIAGAGDVFNGAASLNRLAILHQALANYLQGVTNESGGETLEVLNQLSEDLIAVTNAVCGPAMRVGDIVSEVGALKPSAEFMRHADEGPRGE